MRCDHCSCPDPTAYVELRHNVGMLFMRQEYATAGELCRRCLDRAFWRHTVANLTLGWWGTLSFFMTWGFLATNLATYLRARRELGEARPVRASAPPAVSGEEAQRVLVPFEHNVRLQLRGGDSPDAVCRDLMRIHHVTLEAASRFVQVLAEDEARRGATAA